MDTFESFVKYFTDQTFPSMELNGELFTEGLTPLANERVTYLNERLGTLKRNAFRPAFPLLDRLAPLTEKKAIINDKSAWLFLCGKNVLKEGIIEAPKHDFLLVTNDRGEVLGYGKQTGVGITNLIDRGDFLRRE